MINDVLQHTEEKMRASIEALKKDLATIRTGRASPALIEHLKVDYNGVPMALNQIAGITAPEARLLVIQPWDRSAIGSIEKSILKSELGLRPVSDGNVLRINIPPLSEERRRDLIKIVHKRIEERKIIIRNLRHESLTELKRLEKEKEISQDDLKRSSDQVQKITDKYIDETDKIGKAKENELLEV